MKEVDKHAFQETGLLVSDSGIVVSETEKPVSDCSSDNNDNINDNMITTKAMNNTDMMKSPSPMRLLKNAKIARIAATNSLGILCTENEYANNKKNRKPKTLIACPEKFSDNVFYNTGDKLPSPPPSPPQKNYKFLYEEVKKRLFEQAESGRQRYIELEKAYNELKKKYEEESKMKEQVIKGNNKQISDMQEDVKRIAAKSSAIRLCRVQSNETLFRMKPKKGTKNGQVDSLSCEYKDCSESAFDLVKCNICDTWVCENCNDVPVAKLKRITNKCRTVYFLCKSCDSKIDSQPAPIIDSKIIDSQPAPTDEEEIADDKQTIEVNIQNMINKGFARIEAKIETSISQKLSERFNSIRDGEGERKTPPLITDYAQKVMEVPKEVRKMMQEERNGERIERLERERRATNFIIHGAVERGKTVDEVQMNDRKYIDNMLNHLKVRTSPVSVIRLGGSTQEGKTRVLKIIMSSKNAKQKVISNLGMLKGMQSEFGRISVTDDYTSMEREQIKAKVEEARELSQNDTTRIYKVRGDPQNGLRIVSFTKD